MSNKNEIKSEKILLKDVFDMWFRIPEYQRPYVWGFDQIHDLLDDLTYAATHKPDAEYFMGSFVFQAKPAGTEKNQEFDENDLLDGQQRLTTLLLILAVMRDLTDHKEIKETCQSFIFQKPNKYKHIPERMRFVFRVRPMEEKFFEEYIKQDGGTCQTDNTYPFDKFCEDAKDVSVENLAIGVKVIRDFLQSEDAANFEMFLDFMLNKVLLIYVSTKDLEDAFRLFTILNDRGVPLRNSDILKSINLGALESDSDGIKYAKMWESAEGELGDDFDRFLNHIRTILVKEKARLSLIREFEDKIYNPKEKDKTTGILKPKLLARGKPTFELIEQYLGHYRELIDGLNYSVCDSFEFYNLIRVMQKGLPATDWIPALLRYYDKFGTSRLLDFLHLVNRKFAGDWICQRTPTDRIEAMNSIIKSIDMCNDENVLLQTADFTFNLEDFLRTIQGIIYGKRFARYILLMLDFLYQNQAQKIHLETVSVEHILPQNPNEDSEWVKDFSETQRDKWTHRLGNLVVITRRKNASQGRLDYRDKRTKYFEKNIDSCPNSLRVLNQNALWTPLQLEQNHKIVLEKLLTHFDISIPDDLTN
jgi:hypothetical protein